MWLQKPFTLPVQHPHRPAGVTGPGAPCTPPDLACRALSGLEAPAPSALAFTHYPDRLLQVRRPVAQGHCPGGHTGGAGALWHPGRLPGQEEGLPVRAGGGGWVWECWLHAAACRPAGPGSWGRHAAAYRPAVVACSAALLSAGVPGGCAGAPAAMGLMCYRLPCTSLHSPATPATPPHFHTPLSTLTPPPCRYTLLLMIFATVAQALSASTVMGGCAALLRW